jgi:hypothetical protein
MARSLFVAFSIAACAAALLSADCESSAPVPAAAPQTQVSPPIAGPPASAPSSPAASEAGQEAHRLVIAAAGCWSGGTWADALGEQDLVKQKGIEARCHDLERRVWGGAQDKTHYEQLRALEMNAVADVIAKVDETAKADRVDAATRDALTRLTSALADEEKEVMLARRAADRVKRDLDHEPEKLTADEVDAVAPLRAHAKLEALLKLDAGALSKEAHALGLLRALDRVEIARGLPKHLKLYAVADEFRMLFGVTVPDVPQDATKKLVPGTWLQFLSETAAAAGHPVDEKATTPRERDALAWAGMLRGFSDKLKAEADAISPSTDLAHVVTVALHRLEAEYGAQKAAEETLHNSTAKRR